MGPSGQGTQSRPGESSAGTLHTQVPFPPQAAAQELLQPGFTRGSFFLFRPRILAGGSEKRQLPRLVVTWVREEDLSLKRILHPPPQPPNPKQRPSQPQSAEELVRGPQPSVKPSPGDTPGKQNRPLQSAPHPHLCAALAQGHLSALTPQPWATPLPLTQ